MNERLQERRFAVLIASSLFPEEPTLQELRCPENDVDALYELLSAKDRGGFTECHVLKNEPHDVVHRWINKVLKKAEKDDLVFIYYSGHGKLDTRGRLHLATIDTVLAELESTSVPVATIRYYIDTAYTSKVVLMLDCCYSGAVGKVFSRGSVEDQMSSLVTGRGTYIITASTATETAQEKEEDKYGLFTKYILKGIDEGEADRDGDGFITMDELYRYVREQVILDGHQEPTRWGLDIRGELVLARSGRQPREERRRQIRALLLEWAMEGVLPDSLLRTALEIIGQSPEKLSEDLRRYDDLLDQLAEGTIKVGEFIDAWYKIPRLAPPPPVPVVPAAPKKVPKTRPIFPLPGNAWAAIPGTAEVQASGLYPDFEGFKLGDGLKKARHYYGEREQWPPEAPALEIASFWVASYPITVAQFRPFVEGEGYRNPHYWTETGWRWRQEKEIQAPAYWDDSQWRINDHPIIGISWFEAVAYCRWLTQQMAEKGQSEWQVRLLTEAEWEWVARGPEARLWPWGDAWEERHCNVSASMFKSLVSLFGRDRTQSVGNFPQGGNWTGDFPESGQGEAIYDLAGNVWEWCSTRWQENYPLPRIDKEWTNEYLEGEEPRVLRGGSWYLTRAWARAACRDKDSPENRHFDRGFRCAVVESSSYINPRN